MHQKYRHGSKEVAKASKSATAAKRGAALALSTAQTASSKKKKKKTILNGNEKEKDEGKDEGKGKGKGKGKGPMSTPSSRGSTDRRSDQRCDANNPYNDAGEIKHANEDDDTSDADGDGESKIYEIQHIVRRVRPTILMTHSPRFWSLEDADGMHRPHKKGGSVQPHQRSLGVSSKLPLPLYADVRTFRRLLIMTQIRQTAEEFWDDRENDGFHYYIKWRGYSSDWNTWETLDCMDGCTELLLAFLGNLINSLHPLRFIIIIFGN